MARRQEKYLHTKIREIMYNMLHSPRWPGMWKWEIMQSVFARIRFIIRNRAGGPEGAGGDYCPSRFWQNWFKTCPINLPSILYPPFSEIFRLSAVSKKSMYVHTKLYVLKKCYARKILIEKLSGFSATQESQNFRVIQYLPSLKLKFVESI